MSFNISLFERTVFIVAFLFFTGGSLFLMAKWREIKGSKYPVRHWPFGHQIALAAAVAGLLVIILVATIIGISQFMKDSRNLTMDDQPVLTAGFSFQTEISPECDSTVDKCEENDKSFNPLTFFLILLAAIFLDYLLNCAMPNFIAKDGDQGN